MKNIEKKLDAIIAQANEGLAKADAALADAINRAEAAKATADIAFRDGDLSRYQESLFAREKAESEIGNLREKIGALKTGPLISADEYEELCSKIRDDVIARRRNDIQKAGALIEQIVALADAASEKDDTARRLLRLLQFDVFRDDKSKEYHGLFDQAEKIQVNPLQTLVTWITDESYMPSAFVYSESKKLEE